MAFSDQAAIVGIGATEFSKNSGRSEVRLAAEAVKKAIADAGLQPADIDGVCTFAYDHNGAWEVARAVGLGELSFFGRSDYGGTQACVPIMLAAMAVATGQAKAVVCYRAMNERSEYRFGQAIQTPYPDTENVIIAYHRLPGVATAADLAALAVRRYMYESGATSEDLAQVVISARKHAANNPAAFFYGKPVTLDDYMSARMIADPLRLLDCCQESDGAVAVVVTSAERARDLPHRPALVRAAAQGGRAGAILMSNWFDEDCTHYADSKVVADKLYAQARLGPDDIQAAIIYDHFAPTVMSVVEALGFCARNEAKDFIRNGNIEVGGRLPVNTHGGMIGEAYVHGMNGVAEAVRQIRGSSVNQVAEVENIVVTGASGGPTSGLILSRG